MQEKTSLILKWHVQSTPKTEYKISSELVSWLFKENDFQDVTLWMSKFSVKSDPPHIYFLNFSKTG